MPETNTINIEKVAVHTEGGRGFLDALQNLADTHGATEKPETKKEARARLRKEIAEIVNDVEWFEAVVVSMCSAK